MKKLVALMLVAIVMLMAVGPAMAADAGAAAFLSALIPGAGEWYNNGFQGSFPWGECVVGYICPCFMVSSIFDAANGASDTNMRFDFWSAPSK